MCGILHYVLDSDGPTEIMGALVNALPSVDTSSSTTCWTMATRRRRTCRRPWPRGLAA